MAKALQYGAKGDSVKQLQQALNSAGYKLSVDGIYGNKTKQAVLDFQKKNGLKVDGIVGNNTWGALNKFTTKTTPVQPKTAQTTPTPANTMYGVELPNNLQPFTQKAPTLNLPTYNEQYQQKANQQLTPMYEGVQNTLKQKLANILAQLDMQKQATNAMYNETYSRQQLSNKKSMNNLNNSILARGLGRSSIAVSGQAEMEQIGNRALADIDTKRNMALSQLEQQKQLQTDKVNSEIASLEKEKQSKILELARTLYNEELNNAYKKYGAEVDNYKMQYQIWNDAKNTALDLYKSQIQQEQFNKEYALKQEQFNKEYALKQEQFNKEYALKQQQLKLAKQSSSSGSKSSFASSKKTNSTNKKSYTASDVAYVQAINEKLKSISSVGDKMKFLDDVKKTSGLNTTVKEVIDKMKQDIYKTQYIPQTNYLSNLTSSPNLILPQWQINNKKR